MTRINAGIPPDRLTDQHLIAEYREISRIGTLVRKRISSGKTFTDIPKTFGLGTGHVRFFYDKGGYITKRWDSIIAEMRTRGFKSLDAWDRWIGIPDKYMNDWDDADINIRTILEIRIRERLTKQKGKIRYRGNTMELNKYIYEVLIK